MLPERGLARAGRGDEQDLLGILERLGEARRIVEETGLLDAVAEYGFDTYLAQKAVRPSGGDPVDDLRAGWDLHVGFGLANPALYALMYGDPRPAPPLLQPCRRGRCCVPTSGGWRRRAGCA